MPQLVIADRSLRVYMSRPVLPSAVKLAAPEYHLLAPAVLRKPVLPSNATWQLCCRPLLVQSSQSRDCICVRERLGLYLPLAGKGAASLPQGPKQSMAVPYSVSVLPGLSDQDIINAPDVKVLCHLGQ